MDISNIRTDYKKHEVLENKVENDPITQFKIWFEEAVNSKVNEPNAMHLATIGENNRPTGRIVLLKGFDPQGFSFFTNYKSKKADQIINNNYGCITFFWPELERQVRIEGKIEKLSEDESTKYFKERPRKSQIGAWASPQSKIIENRESLESDFEKFELKFGDEPIPKPEIWGGYILKPDYFEFWQGRRSRLHDRIIYTINEPSEWEINRLAP